MCCRPVTCRTQRVDTTAEAAMSSRSSAEIAGIVALYFVVSISLVFVNKLLLTKGNSIPAPLFVTWSQCVVTVIICWALGIRGREA